MNIPFARLHRDSALALFRLRQGRLSQYETAAVSLGRLERRLRLHLHMLERCWSARRWIRGSAGRFCSPSEGVAGSSRKMLSSSR
jgi:hypothetical protein